VEAALLEQHPDASSEIALFTMVYRSGAMCIANARHGPRRRG